MKTYQIYAKTDCDFCKKAVDLLSIKELPFIVTVCDKNPTYLESVKQLYNWPTVPLIIRYEEEEGKIEEKFIGGFSELEAALNE